MVTRPDPADEPRPRAWARPAAVDPESHIARQLELINTLIARSITGPDFARAYLAERRESLNAGERLREAFDRALNEVFYAIEDYVIDPEMRDAGDMTDDDLISRVTAAHTLLQQLR